MRLTDDEINSILMVAEAIENPERAFAAKPAKESMVLLAAYHRVLLRMRHLLAERRGAWKEERMRLAKEERLRQAEIKAARRAYEIAHRK